MSTLNKLFITVSVAFLFSITASANEPQPVYTENPTFKDVPFSPINPKVPDNATPMELPDGTVVGWYQEVDGVPVYVLYILNTATNPPTPVGFQITRPTQTVNPVQTQYYLQYNANMQWMLNLQNGIQQAINSPYDTMVVSEFPPSHTVYQFLKDGKVVYRRVSCHTGYKKDANGTCVRDPNVPLPTPTPAPVYTGGGGSQGGNQGGFGGFPPPNPILDGVLDTPGSNPPRF